MTELSPVVIEGAEIIFRNFEGKEDTYNRAGDRNFTLILPEDLAQAMLHDGWNVRQLRAREEGDDPRWRIDVAVAYKVKPPKAWLITSRGRTPIGESEIGMLDQVDMVNVDLIINPYPWAVGDKSGIKAYLGSIFVTIAEDPLELKYGDLPTAHI